MATKKERLENKANMNLFDFSNAPEPESEKKQNESKAEEEKKVTYSARISQNLVEEFKLYCQCHGCKAADIMTEAIREYIGNHPLEGTEAKLFKERQEKRS